MAVKIRLARRGRKKLALYDIVAADARASRDGRFIEKLGNYNPHTHPATILLKKAKILRWLAYGAQPTLTVSNILSSQGILLRRHLQVGVKKGAITQEEADKRWETWQQTRTSQLTKKAEKFTQEVKTQSASKKPLDTQEKTAQAHTQPQEAPQHTPPDKKEELKHDTAPTMSASATKAP